MDVKNVATYDWKQASKQLKFPFLINSGRNAVAGFSVNFRSEFPLTNQAFPSSLNQQGARSENYMTKKIGFGASSMKKST